jgi:uncharacterized membrane protein YbhN (UPF0104 family)
MLTRYRLLRIFKITAFLVSVVYITWYIVRTKPTLNDPSVVSRIQDHFTWIAVVFILMLVNWSIEAIKWRMLLVSVESVSFLQSLRAVFSGVTVSFYTPNRVGEFAGRILHLDPEHRVRGALATFVGSTAQVMVTLQAGLAALIYFRTDFVNEKYQDMIIIPALLFIVILPVAWLQIPRLAYLKPVGKLLKHFPKYLEIFDHYSQRQMLLVYLLSFLRYGVFCTQQFLLLYSLGFAGSWILSAGLSALAFLVISIVPSIALGELGMRGGINLVIFTPYFNDGTAVLFTTFLLWFINLALPALGGAIGLLYIKIRKNG